MNEQPVMRKRPNGTPTVILHTKIHPDAFDVIDREARSRGRSRGWIIEQLVKSAERDRLTRQKTQAACPMR